MFIKLLLIASVFLVSCGNNTTPKPDPKLDFTVEKKEEIEVIGRLLDKKLKVDCVKEEFELATDLFFH